MMVGISTSYFACKGLSVYESVKRAHDLGFKFIELGANHNFEENVFGTLKKIKKDFPETTFSLHAYFPPVFKVPTNINAAYGLTVENQTIIKSMIQGARILKVKIISFHSGFNHRYKLSGLYQDFEGFKEFLPYKKIDSDQAYQNQKKFFDFAVSKAQKEGISVLMEVVYSKYMGQPTLLSKKAYFDFLEAVPGLGFLLDYAHAFIEFKNPDEFFKLGQRIKEIHLSDVQNKSDHYVLGTGEINLKKLFAKIKKLAFLPPIILEHAGGVKEEKILEEKRMIGELIRATN